MKVTISFIKADVGSIAGHVTPPEELLDIAEEEMEKALEENKIIDYDILVCGDDIGLLMTHQKGVDSPEIHGLAWNTFKKMAEKAKEMKLYGAGQDLLKEAFSGNIRGMGPGIAEMEIEERPAEPFAVFFADKTEPGAWNIPLFKIFADPFNTAGLVISPRLHRGFRFEIHDVIEHKRVFLDAPEEMYDILALIGQSGRYVIKRVYNKDGKIAAVTSIERLSLIAGRYVGKDDPVMIVRAQHEFPAMGEILEAFATPWLVKGWMRGSHHGPMIPVSFWDAHPTRFDGPPRVIGAGYNLKNGELIGPVDLFDDPAFEYARWEGMKIADYIRRHGPFEPHRLGPEEMEYTTLPQVLEKLKDRFEDLK